MDIGRESQREAIKLWTRCEWGEPGELNSEKNLQQVLQFIDEASKRGFQGIRIAIDLTSTLGTEIRAQQIERWEASLDSILAPDFPRRIICQYNRSRVAPEVVLAALHTHRSIILGGVCG